MQVQPVLPVPLVSSDRLELEAKLERQVLLGNKDGPEQLVYQDHQEHRGKRHVSTEYEVKLFIKFPLI